MATDFTYHGKTIDSAGPFRTTVKNTPLNAKYREGTQAPVNFTRPLEVDYLAKRERIVQEELDINRIVCPVENIHDKSILYTCSQAILDGIKEEKPASLFTVTEE